MTRRRLPLHSAASQAHIRRRWTLAVAASALMACDGDGIGRPGSGSLRPRLSLQIADTVWGRALTLEVTASGPRPILGFSYALDGAAPTTPGTSSANGGGLVDRSSDSTWTLYVSESLPAGAHRATVIVVDSGGGSDTVTRTFQSRVDSASYHLMALPTLGGTQAWANDINEAGIVAGSALDSAGIFHPVTWIAGRVQLLPHVGSGFALALNDVGTVVGRAQDPRLARVCQRGVVWRNGSAPELLREYPNRAPPDTGFPCGPLLPERIVTLYRILDATMPFEVNDRGSIVTGGYLDRGGEITELAPSGDWLRTFALNNRDQAAVSVSRRPAYEYNAVAVGFGVVVGYPGLDVDNRSGAARRYVYVAGMNDNGTVVGNDSMALRRAFLSDPAGRATDLGPVTGDLRAVHLNNRGDVLLSGHLLRLGRLAAIRILEPGWSLVTVTRINDAGHIIGSARDAAGRTHAVLLTPGP